MQLEEHLFRRESGRMVLALTRVFGLHNLALAEDVVQDAFCRALDVWRVRGVPDNPSAWLITAAKNRALDVLRRQRTARSFTPALTRALEGELALVQQQLDEAFAVELIRDEQLRMMFSCCDPALPEEVQIAIILNVLCGFGVGEIASAFLISEAAAEKRITRGKAVLRTSTKLFELASPDFVARLAAVRRALYLLFNEGYHGASSEAAVRKELCEEALRLTDLLADFPPAATPTTHALAALLCLHAARLPARLDGARELSAFEDQDRSQWDAERLRAGLALLERASSGDELTPYQVEAAIAATHAAAVSVEATDWSGIVSLYDSLLALAPSPVAALSRAIAVGMRDGPDAGLALLAVLPGRERLSRSPLLPAAVGELELRAGRADAAAVHFQSALQLARNGSEQRYLEKRLANCLH